jgi:hypothetical protein
VSQPITQIDFESIIEAHQADEVEAPIVVHVHESRGGLATARDGPDG